MMQFFGYADQLDYSLDSSSLGSIPTFLKTYLGKDAYLELLTR